MKTYLITLEPESEFTQKTIKEATSQQFIQDLEIINGVNEGSLAGCRKSHLKVMNQAIRDGHSKILILEDDVTFTDNISRYVEYFPDDYGTIFLGSHIPKPYKYAKPERINKYLIRSHRTWLNHAYVVNLQHDNIQKILKFNTNDTHFGISKLINDRVSKKGSSFIVTPFIAWQKTRSLSSTQNIKINYIEGMKTSEKWLLSH